MDAHAVGLIAVRIDVVRSDGTEIGDWGITLSRTDGWYDILVNGGGALQLRFMKEGFRPAQLAASVGWNGFAVVDDVVLYSDPEYAARFASRNNASSAQHLRSAPCRRAMVEFDFAPRLITVPDALDFAPARRLSSRALVEAQILQEVISLPDSDWQLVCAPFRDGVESGIVFTF